MLTVLLVRNKDWVLLCIFGEFAHQRTLGLQHARQRRYGNYASCSASGPDHITEWSLKNVIERFVTHAIHCNKYGTWSSASHSQIFG